jgi:VWFA-related protein
MKHSVKLTLCLLTLTLVVCGATSQTPETRRLKVSIVNEENHSLDNIQEQDVEVLENGVRQQAKLEKQQLPVCYALVVDTSGSLRSQFENVVETAKAFIRTNSDNDETAVIRFVDSSVIKTVQPFTNDKRLLISKVDGLYVEGGYTALLDAIHASFTYVNQGAEKNPTKNHALVLITDGENRKNNHKLAEVIKLIQTKNIRIYTIGLTSELDEGSGLIGKPSRKKAEELLLDLAKHSGGRTFFVKKGEDFPKAISEVIHDMRNYYVVSYTPTTASVNPKIEINVAKSADKKSRKAIFNSFVAN